MNQLEPRTRTLLQAYTDGVNAYLAQSSLLPVEFYVFRCSPAPWDKVDSLTWLRMMAWNLSGNWFEELLNTRLKRRLTPQQIAELMPPYPGDPAPVWPGIDGLYPEAPAATARSGLRYARAPRSTAIGSNNWAVSGALTQTGKPLLANDPHTKLSMPSLWYLAHLHAPGLDVIGATLPGVPGVFLGRNEHVAWAFTNTGSDTQDLYVEEPIAGREDFYRTPKGFARFEVVAEVIKVRGHKDVPLNVRITRHGPVISDNVPEAARVAAPNLVLALSWVGLRSDDLTLQFMAHAATARNGVELFEAARYLHTPQQNVVYADTQGTIGFVAAGRVPVRRNGNRARGLLPVPGWDSLYDWTGEIPYEELPREVNPASRTVVTANQKITPPDYAYWLTSGWAPPYRAERISELLKQQDRHSVSSFSAIQADVVDPVAGQLLPYLLEVEASSEEERQALSRLRAWDKAMTRESAEGLIFVSWIRHLNDRLLRTTLAEDYDAFGDYNPQFLVNVLRDRGGISQWCGPASASDPEPCKKLASQALAGALSELRSRFDDDPSLWSWGRSHIVHPRSALADFLGPLSRFLGMNHSIPGGMDTVNVSGYSYDDASGEYQGESGPSFRAIYDLADVENSIFVINSGQSGSPFSPHYGDLADLWSDGKHVPMTTDRARILDQSQGRLRLEPS